MSDLKAFDFLRGLFYGVVQAKNISLGDEVKQVIEMHVRDVIHAVETVVSIDAAIISVEKTANPSLIKQFIEQVDALFKTDVFKGLDENGRLAHIKEVLNKAKIARDNKLDYNPRADIFKMAALNRIADYGVDDGVMKSISQNIDDVLKGVANG